MLHQKRLGRGNMKVLNTLCPIYLNGWVILENISMLKEDHPIIEVRPYSCISRNVKSHNTRKVNS